MHDRRRRLPIFYRDGDCIDVASETVWLALECKGIEYVTVLAHPTAPDVPRIVWPDDHDDYYERDDEGGDDDQGGDSSPAAAPTTTTTTTTTIVTDPILLLEEIQRRYPNESPQFYPKVSSAVDVSRCNVLRLPGVMPRNTDPKYMSSAPYVFLGRGDGRVDDDGDECDDDGGGGLISARRSSIAVTLEEIEEMMEEYDAGPFLCGRDICAADIGEWREYK